MSLLIFNILLTAIASYSYAAPSFTEPTLSSIEQLTSPQLGFEKAGEGYFSPDGEKIIFQGVPTGEEDYQIFTLDLKSREFVRITHDKGACTCAFFRPDGKKIIYAASPKQAQKAPPGVYKWDFTPYMNIYEAEIDGSNPRLLTQGSAYHAECAYSPDGSEIVYASNEEGSMNLYVMKSDGSDVRRVTSTDHCYNGGPFFSPKGKEIIFRADPDQAHLLQIYKIDATGENLVQLTEDEAVNWAPFWHPSGEAIVYTTSLHGHHNYQIYFQNLKTHRRYRITYAPTFNGLATFNKEGTRLLWTSKRGEDNTSQLFIADFHLPQAWLEQEEP